MNEFEQTADGFSAASDKSGIAPHTLLPSRAAGHLPDGGTKA
ncbi:MULTISPECIES: hypothetical protein [unclassified Streptomyces]|nr:MULTISPECIES: hypothetical protein [unclassified Streptomyces]WSA93800.1 hypothetical protein OIE63_21115 [Streptomyces sp. NBC_01795]WSB78170.1 hypothetical protein OHB04_21955 [Streptomyces sp. NBC_01775]WSS13578.1 hypothetical protein OG533_18030 [Streptomyces sp. NBC_01186]WSS42373.1 hypothetical protein OG220_18640 [Streptomyces sp. NBC_01187]